MILFRTITHYSKEFEWSGEFFFHLTLYYWNIYPINKIY